ncbi:mannonate dehydratase [Chengkuizengella axinellae]|uniref:Mannonate dehydratase n=1 Tax=Chengkuizengella axinellae TaxID=3064388 RepID=A0ABT9IXF8_9BACL|nr:mannonate dehydratase [Chengkuizengella sp. 2205SS18-9]MDP5274061.1 mannonate dehydratase [Chengkuizengella sp. 2205SS18-9]
MNLSFRWYDKKDPIPLKYIRQIPGMKGIVSAIYDVPVGEVWPYHKIVELKKKIEEEKLELSVIESLPVHEDIKLGLPTRDKYIENYKQSLQNLGKAGVTVVCYNFMPVFDWTRSELKHELEDGSTTLIFENEKVQKMDPVKGELSLPGWDSSYEKEELHDLMRQYQNINEEKLWDNLNYFIQEVIPVAEKNNIKMAIHPDDPPWGIFGLPRIIVDQSSLERFTNLYDSVSNGICFCTGSFGARTANNLVEMIRSFGSKNRIHFVHTRNVKITGEDSFEETAHLSSSGDVNMLEIMKALKEVNFNGPLRPDHGRMIWGEEGKAGYGLFDRALGATYLNGLWEAVSNT